MRLWTRHAKLLYAGPGKSGELFNSASFQTAVCETTGTFPDSHMTSVLLTLDGYHPGFGGAHWFKDYRLAAMSRTETRK